MKKRNVLLIIDCVVLIILLIAWLTFAMFTGDTDVQCIHLPMLF